MAKGAICLWYHGTAEDAANFHARILPDSTVRTVHNAPRGYPGGKREQVLTAEFTVLGVTSLGLDGGPEFKHSEAFSLQIIADDQSETDRYRDAIVENDGTESACGWCKNTQDLSWQITPRRLLNAIADPDTEAAKRASESPIARIWPRRRTILQRHRFRQRRPFVVAANSLD